MGDQIYLRFQVNMYIYRKFFIAVQLIIADQLMKIISGNSVDIVIADKLKQYVSFFIADQPRQSVSFFIADQLGQSVSFFIADQLRQSVSFLYCSLAQAILLASLLQISSDNLLAFLRQIISGNLLASLIQISSGNLLASLLQISSGNLLAALLQIGKFFIPYQLGKSTSFHYCRLALQSVGICIADYLDNPLVSLLQISSREMIASLFRLAQAICQLR